MSTEKQLLTAGAANITITIDIAAPLAETWRAMIADIGQWWREDFLVCEGSLGMHLEPRAGGKLFEKLEGEGGFVWGSIISFQPDKHLAYVAQIVPPWGGPAQSVVQIALSPSEADPDGSTTLVLTDSLIGHVTDDLVSSLDEGWRQLYGDGGLKSYVESK